MELKNIKPEVIKKVKQIWNKINNTMKREELVLGTAKALINENLRVTTLEIKQQLIEDYPEYYWKQDFISQVMKDNEDQFSFSDNGTFRTYYDKVQVKSKKTDSRPTKKVPVTKLATLVNENKGKFVTIVHTKTDGSLNLMNCQILTPTAIGTVLVSEQGKKKSFYPKDLLEVRVKGEIYVKK